MTAFVWVTIFRSYVIDGANGLNLLWEFDLLYLIYGTSSF